MQLFYDPAIVPPLHTLGEEESKHCIRVLRLERGATLHITDGRGTLYRCRIVEDDPRRCTVEVVETIPDFERLSYALTVAVAPTKNADRFEWFLEKATEVGIGAVIPLETEHSERRVFKAERSEKIITAAMKQSLKAYRRCCTRSPRSARRCSPLRGAAADRPLRGGTRPLGQTLPARGDPPGRVRARLASAPRGISPPPKWTSRSNTDSRRSRSGSSA